MTRAATESRVLADRILELQAEAAEVEELLLQLPACGSSTWRWALERRVEAANLLRDLEDELSRRRAPHGDTLTDRSGQSES